VRWKEGSSSSSYKVEPEAVAELYRRWVMPLTKEVQIQYLLRRLDDEADLPSESQQ
jgi:chorismate mutase